MEATQLLVDGAAYHGYSIWLFTVSDIKTIIMPSAFFAIVTAQASDFFSHSLRNHQLSNIIYQSPLVLLWLWINLLPFNIANQLLPGSIAEDRINKSWRTIPSERMTPMQALGLMLCLYPFALLISLYIGGVESCLSLMVLGFWYNFALGSDRSWIERHSINALGYNRFCAGALVVLTGRDDGIWTRRLLEWQVLIAAAIFTTIHAQDLHDQEGDAARHRQTAPLVFGNHRSRVSIAILVAMWSIIFPAYVGTNLWGYALSGGAGCIVATRTLLLRSRSADMMTFKLWNLWICIVYALPLMCSGGHTDASPEKVIFM